MCTFKIRQHFLSAYINSMFMVTFEAYFFCTFWILTNNKPNKRNFDKQQTQLKELVRVWLPPPHHHHHHSPTHLSFFGKALILGPSVLLAHLTNYTHSKSIHIPTAGDAGWTREFMLELNMRAFIWPAFAVLFFCSLSFLKNQARWAFGRYGSCAGCKK